MYVTKDDEIDPTQYIFAIPVITFSCSAKDDQEMDFVLSYNVFGDKDKQRRLIQEMKKALQKLL